MLNWKLGGWLYVFALMTSLISASMPPQAVAAEPPVTKTIRVAIYADEGASKEAPPEVRKCLPTSAGFHVETITAEQIRRDELKKFDVLIQPGGSGHKQADTLGKEGCQRVKQFVTDGGGFIGICAGAYLASIEYPWSLGLLNAHVIDDAHWARGQGDVQLRLASGGDHCTIHYENGPLLGPGEKAEIGEYESLAKFDTEMAENGAPTGIMKGATAIARGKFGKGRVECFSPHPEKTPGREAFLQAAVRWVAQRSANGD